MERTAVDNKSPPKSPAFSPSAPATSRLVLLPGSEVLRPIYLTSEDVDSYSVRDSAVALVETQLKINASNAPPLSIQRATQIVGRTLQHFYGWVDHYREEILLAMNACVPEKLPNLNVNAQITDLKATIKLLQEYRTVLAFAAGIKIQSSKTWLGSQDKCLRNEQFFQDILVGQDEEEGQNFYNDQCEDGESFKPVNRVSIWSVLYDTLLSEGLQHGDNTTMSTGMSVLIPPVDMQCLHGNKLLLASRGDNSHFKKYQFKYKYFWGGVSHDQPLLEWCILTYNLAVYTAMLAFAEYRRLTCPLSRIPAASPAQTQHFMAKYDFELGSSGLACGESLNFLKWFGKSIVADGCESLYGVGKTNNSVTPECQQQNGGGDVASREKCITQMLHGIILLDVDVFKSRSGSTSSAKHPKETIYLHCDRTLDGIRYIRNLFKESLVLVKVLADTHSLEKISKEDFTVNCDTQSKYCDFLIKDEELKGRGGGYFQERQLLIKLLGPGLVGVSEILCSLNVHHLMYLMSLIETVSVCLDLDRVRMEALKSISSATTSDPQPQLKKSLLQWAYFYVVLSTFMTNNKDVLETEASHCITNVQETFFDTIYPTLCKTFHNVPDKRSFLAPWKQQQQPAATINTMNCQSTSKSGIDSLGHVLLDEMKEWGQSISEVLRSNESEKDILSTFTRHSHPPETSKCLTVDELDLLRRWVFPLPGKQYGYCMKFGPLLDYGRVFYDYVGCLLVHTLATQEAFVKNDITGDSNTVDVGALYYYNPQTFPTSMCIDLLTRDTRLWNSQTENLRMTTVDPISQVQLNWFLNTMMCVKALVMTHQRLQHINVSTKTRTLPKTFQMRCPHEFLSTKGLNTLALQKQHCKEMIDQLLHVSSRPPIPVNATLFHLRVKTTAPVTTTTVAPIANSNVVTKNLLSSPMQLWNEKLYNVLLFLTGKVSLMVQGRVVPMTVHNLLTKQEIEQDIVRVCVNYYMIHGGAIALQDHTHGGDHLGNIESAGHVDKYKVLLQKEIEALPSFLKERALTLLFDIIAWSPNNNK